MRVYLDTCSIQRPLDDKAQLRIHLEAEAVLRVLDLVHAGRIELVSSDALLFESTRNPHRTRQEFALETLKDATRHIDLSMAVESRARELNKTSVGILDSFHLAFAEESGADFFCTCDDSFLAKAKQGVKGMTRVVSPLDLAEELEKWLSQRDH